MPIQQLVDLIIPLKVSSLRKLRAGEEKEARDHLPRQDVNMDVGDSLTRRDPVLDGDIEPIALVVPLNHRTHPVDCCEEIGDLF